MKNNFRKILLFLFILFFTNNLSAEVVKKIVVKGNERISDETVVVYGDIEVNKNYTQEDIDIVLKKLYETKFFSKVSINFSLGVLNINVEENPIIDKILVKGEPAQKYIEGILNLLSLKEKSSFLKSEVKKDIETIKNFYRSLGYYSPTVEARVQDAEIGKNLLNLIFSVERGTREKISKIYFIGDKKVKTKRLRDVIASEEARFWKFISRNVYLNEDRIELDKRLLKRYFLGKGYYDVQILSSNVFLKENQGIELTFSINAGKRYRIKKISTNIQPVFDKSIFKPLESDFKKYAGKYYSPFKITKILENIDRIIDDNELQFVEHSVSETIDGDFIDVEFKIYEGRKVQIERVNIFGNTVTNDEVIRSELVLDEGDPFSKIKLEKSVSNLKARRIFKDVKQKIIDGSSNDLKVLEIYVEEKPTGEISAGAGTGTDGTTFQFALKENNYLGKGLNIETSLELTENSIRGGLEVSDPNYNYSGNSLDYGVFSRKTDNSDSGYENTLTSASIGTRFEQYKDVYFNPNVEFSIDDLQVEDNASSNLKKQAGTFTDLIFTYGIDKDTRDRRFMPTSGSIIGFSQSLPVYADAQSSITNKFSLSKYHGFSDDVIGAIKFYSAAITALDDDVRLSRRLHLPSNRLRGFQRKKIGPKDGTDFIGGNYATALNLEAALPNLLPDATQTDIAVFMDTANLWHADYDGTVGQSSKIRSSFGIASNVYTIIGPLNFVLAQNLSKADSDLTETFRFQIGTSF